ncbi:Uncharacterized protein FWK35_00032608, partial [Aphis craccivora]
MNVLILLCCVFFFLSVYTRTCRNNASISNFGVGALGRSFFEFPKTQGKTKKKLRKNGNFYAKPVFDQINFFIWLLTNHLRSESFFVFNDSYH